MLLVVMVVVVVNEARCFVPKKCRPIFTRIIYLIPLN